VSASSDVVVVGSGGAGLTAALAAASDGADVVVIERSELVGGTTAVSGGTTWIPANHRAAAAGCADTAEAALAYLHAGGGDALNAPLLEAFVASGPTMLRFLEERAPMTFYIANDTDYHPELPGARRVGRSVLPSPFDPTPLAAWAERVRGVDLPLDVAEALGSLNPAPAGDDERSSERWTRGRALVGALLHGCLEHGVRVLTGHRARRLLTDVGGVTGI